MNSSQNNDNSNFSFTRTSVLIIIFVLVLIIFYVFNNKNKLENYTLLDEKISIDEKDNRYLTKFKPKIMTPLVSNNRITNSLKVKNDILIITFDNRTNQDYIKLHNENLEEYCKKWKFDYKFYDKCKQNVYWCKIYMVLDALNNNKYDYVMWMDSDTYIFNMDIDLSDVLNEYHSDIYVGLDNHVKYDFINAGVFIIKNSPIGRQYLEECIASLNPSCVKSDGSLNGRWAGTCYEQGIMNILIADKYKNYTTVLSNNILLNFGKCNNDVFIMHLYGSSNDTRTKCFNSKDKALD